MRQQQHSILMIKTAYLAGYNVVSAVGWAYILWHLCSLLYDDADVVLSSAKLWSRIAIPLEYLQTMALLEVVHALVGVVRSPVGSALMQVSSRLFVLWVVLVLCPSSRYHWGFLLTIGSWSMVEVPRYAFYALSVIGWVPDWLFFLRYHLYLILYITGLVGELTCMVNALPFLSTGIYSIELPNKHNIAISLHAVVCGMLVLYVVCCPIMYKHMTTQRINAYAKKHGDNNVKAN
ncbi:hypothetical protein H257_11605 [Aphanomyces astaci]|uniref:very-long-chain (3R)-3-hydroxyacyl-CoA dehydratase n=1 Tax=Aphanomyces astaci TaxID=112090 RepID=W4G2H0_APHAT|nr:hypothetical protein H257_11605 [Aphanomyces astaci]ETV73476.1 hypothetical protein H257_11605 [Aphanomyces astaci]|eukprot:XP_009836902.1 hypothetical protein H257_11605 [Aphanomyces astaci]